MMTPQKKVLFVTGRGERLAGAERSLLGLLEGLDRGKFHAVVAVPERGELSSRLEQIGIRVLVCRLGIVARSRNPFRTLASIFRLAAGVLRLSRVIRREEAAIVHCNQNVYVLYAAAASWLSGAACVWHVRNRVERFWLAGSIAYRMADRIICISDSLRQPFLDAFADAGEKVLTVHNGIGVADRRGKEPLASLRDEFGIGSGDRVVGTVGRITRWKGQDCFLKAASAVADGCPVLKVFVVGDCIEGTAGEQRDAEVFRDELHSLAADLGIASRTVFTGYREDAANIMRLFDVFVLPSVEEPFGRVLLEAMAGEVPVVATASGGVPEIIRDGKDGLLVPPREPEPMARAISSLLDDRELACQLVASASSRVVEQFSMSSSVKRVEAVFEGLS